jgi:response regulator RpfG family c-di-GMP phosphodiesterase
VTDAQPTIFVVSDTNAQPIAWLGAWLATQPWPVTWRLEVAAAVRCALADHPRLVVVDVSDALDLGPRCGLIAELHRRRPQTALAAAAACADEVVERAVRAAGVNVYLVDPADLPALSAALELPAGGFSTASAAPSPSRRRAHRVRGRPPWPPWQS